MEAGERGSYSSIRCLISVCECDMCTTLPTYVLTFRLRSSAMSRFEELKEQTATGLRHAVETRNYSDIKVNFQPSYIILPQDGVYRK